MKAKKFLAALTAATMVIAPASTAFAEDYTKLEDITAITSDATVDYIDLSSIIKVTAPTKADLGFTLDPQNLAATKTVGVWDPEKGGTIIPNNVVTFVNRSAIPVKTTINFSITDGAAEGSKTTLLSSADSIDTGTDKKMFLTVTPSKLESIITAKAINVNNVLTYEQNVDGTADIVYPVAKLPADATKVELASANTAVVGNYVATSEANTSYKKVTAVTEGTITYEQNTDGTPDIVYASADVPEGATKIASADASTAVVGNYVATDANNTAYKKVAKTSGVPFYLKATDGIADLEIPSTNLTSVDASEKIDTDKASTAKVGQYVATSAEKTAYKLVTAEPLTTAVPATTATTTTDFTKGAAGSEAAVTSEGASLAYLVDKAKYFITNTSGKYNLVYKDDILNNNYETSSFIIGGSLNKNADWSVYNDTVKIQLTATYTFEKMTDATYTEAKTAVITDTYNSIPTTPAAESPKYFDGKTSFDVAATSTSFDLPFDYGTGSKATTIESISISNTNGTFTDIKYTPGTGKITFNSTNDIYVDYVLKNPTVISTFTVKTIDGTTSSIIANVK